MIKYGNDYNADGGDIGDYDNADDDYDDCIKYCVSGKNATMMVMMAKAVTVSDTYIIKTKQTNKIWWRRDP